MNINIIFSFSLSLTFHLLIYFLILFVNSEPHFTYRENENKIISTFSLKVLPKKVVKNIEKHSMKKAEQFVKQNDSAETISKPEVIGVVRPVYPFHSRLNSEEGSVGVRVFVNKDGEPESVRIISSSGYQRLDHEALKAVKSARFKPASVLGINRAQNLDLFFHFSLKTN